jgi:hypothetical protein
MQVWVIISGENTCLPKTAYGIRIYVKNHQKVSKVSKTAKKIDENMFQQDKN